MRKRPPIYELTNKRSATEQKREKAVRVSKAKRLLSEGKTPKEVAEIMKIRIETVQRYRREYDF